MFQSVPKHVIIQIEVKDKGNVMAQRETVRLIHKYSREKTTVIGGEREQDCLKLHKMNSEIPKFMSGDAVIKYMFYYWTGLLPFVHIY